jgi:hypothetical protein
LSGIAFQSLGPCFPVETARLEFYPPLARIISRSFLPQEIPLPLRVTIVSLNRPRSGNGAEWR